MIHGRQSVFFCYGPSTKVPGFCLWFNLASSIHCWLIRTISDTNSCIHKKNFALKISSLDLKSIVSLFSEFTISFASLFPLPSCFLRPPKSRTGRRDEIIFSGLKCYSHWTSVVYIQPLSQIFSNQEFPCSRDQRPHEAWEGRSKPSTDVLRSFLD